MKKENKGSQCQSKRGLMTETDVSPRDLFTSAYSWDYAVFRCAPARTAEYEEKLKEGGWDVFSPQHWIHRRLPRRKRRVWEKRSLFPSFLFLSVAHRPGTALRLISANVVGLKPMMDRGKIVCFSREEFENLLELDERDKNPEGTEVSVIQFKPGDRVALNGSADTKGVIEKILEGREGEVIRVNDSVGEVFVAIKNSPVRLWISGLLLERVSVKRGGARPSVPRNS